MAHSNKTLALMAVLLVTLNMMPGTLVKGQGSRRQECSTANEGSTCAVGQAAGECVTGGHELEPCEEFDTRGKCKIIDGVSTCVCDVQTAPVGESCGVIGGVEFFCQAGGICADPHFFGYDGSSFDFQGEDGKVYNLITDAEHQINVLLVRRGMHFDRRQNVWYQLPTHRNTSTWMGAIAFQYKSDRVLVEKTAEQHVKVMANDKVLDEGEAVMLPDGTEVLFTNKTYAAGQQQARCYATV